jgi:hypothetical protein|eukprot:COSAG02_NODE_6239_length_3706_cov_4.560022_2_plen_175_part_00
MAIAADSATNYPARRAPRVWALRVALIALVAAGVTLAALPPRSGTITEQHKELQFACLADTTALSRDWHACVTSRGTHGPAWWNFGVQLLRAFSTRPAVAWSMTVGAISRLESQRSLSLRRPWLPIAAIAGESTRIMLVKCSDCERAVYVLQVLQCLTPPRRRTAPTRPAASCT